MDLDPLDLLLNPIIPFVPKANTPKSPETKGMIKTHINAKAKRKEKKKKKCPVIVMIIIPL